MSAFDPKPGQERRSWCSILLLWLFIVEYQPMGHAMPNSKEIKVPAHKPVPQGYVLGAGEGEHLIHFRDAGNISIKVDSLKGSNNFALGTQQLPMGSGIPVHRHFQMDEAFYVLEGSGTFTLNDVPHSCERGGTIFIPRNTWHGFSSPDQELVLLWIMVPPGLDGFFRETCSPPGEPRKELTREQINTIALKYGTEFRCVWSSLPA